MEALKEKKPESDALRRGFLFLLLVDQIDMADERQGIRLAVQGIDKSQEPDNEDPQCGQRRQSPDHRSQDPQDCSQDIGCDTHPKAGQEKEQPLIPMKSGERRILGCKHRQKEDQVSKGRNRLILLNILLGKGLIVH